MRVRVAISIFAGLLTTFVVGIVLDTCTLFTMVSTVSAKTALMVYAAGFPINVAQGVSTAVCMFVFANPLLEKLERVRKKYGLFE